MRVPPGVLRWMLAAALAVPCSSQMAGPGSNPAPGDGGGVSGSHFAPASVDILANQTTNYTQYEPKLALRPDGLGFVVVWASAVGADVYARVFNGQGVPATGQIQVDTTFTNGTQDEPTVAMDETGRFLVAWSDRQGSDGSDMGIFARVFGPTGAPLGPDFQLNVTWLGSQWAPFAAARPGGGWVVGWSGTDGGKTYMRLLAANGTPQTGELDVAQFNSKQVDPVPAVGRDGSMFFAWIDFNGKAGAGNATSVFGRYFDALGNPAGNEFQVNTTNPGEQRNARTAADAIGRFLVVWEDRQTNADGIDIHARRYSKLGFPLSGEWQVNTTTGGDQILPEAAFDWVGNSVIVWEDRSAGAGEIRAQRYNPQGVALGSEFVVNATPTGDQTRPDVAVDWAGENFVFAFTSLGSTLDVYARRFRFRPLTQVGPAKTNSTFALELDLPGSAGLYRLVLMALGTVPGLPLPDGRHLALNYDPLFSFMLSNGGSLPGFVGPMPADATDMAAVPLPANPVLVGLTLQIAAITLDLGQSGLGNQLRHVTGALPVTIQ